MSLVLVALLVGVTSVTSSSVLGQTSEETSLAAQSARGVMETLRGAEFATVVASYNDVGNDDPGGTNTAPGPDFAAPSLGAQSGDPDGLAGEVLLPLDAAGRLLENQNRPEFGLPMDLNSDGVIDGADHSLDYTILPVIVRIDWAGRTGDRSIQLSTILGDN